MEILPEDKRIAELIAREIVYGLTEQEKAVLQEWLDLSDRNKQLHESLISRERIISYEQRLSKINVGKYRREMEKTMGVSRSWFVSYWKYAAAVIVLLLGTTTLVWQWHTDEGVKTVLTAQQKEIEPGTQKAVLVLADGHQVDLGAMKDRSVEVDGIEVSGERAVVKGKNSNVPEITWNKIITPRGGEYCLELSDGTVVYINSESQLEFPVAFNGKNREVHLKGEAYFRVAKSTEHPFVVKTDKMDVLVTGTEFNIKAYAGEKLVQTTLVEGRVSVATGSDKQQTSVLKPSQQAQLNLTDNKVEVRDVDVSSFIAWKNGQFIFKGDRLEDIMTVLARWYDFEIFYLNDSVKDIVFAGRLNRMEAINPILEIIESTQKINVQIKGKSIVLSAK